MVIVTHEMAFARAVGADQAGNLGGTHGNVKAVHGGEAAEVNA